LRRGWTRFSLSASTLAGMAIAVAMAAAMSSARAFPQDDDAGRRFNELTLAGLRPGRDKLPAALKHYKPKFLDAQDTPTAKAWTENCTGHSLRLELDEHSEIESITVTSLDQQEGKCDQSRMDALDIKSWITGRGLHLGDTQDRVTLLYGEPNSTGPSVKGEKELEFLYYQFDWAGSDVPQVLEVYCARDTGRMVEMTLSYPSL
jgi:hypothetical protein